MCMSHGSYSKDENYNLLEDQNLEIGESGAEFTIQHVDLINQNIGNVNENNEIYYNIIVKENPKDIFKYRRWIVLVLVCLIGMGIEFGYMTGNVIEKQLIQDIGTTQKGFDILISIYSWPNIILPFIGGYIIDKFGTKVILILFLIIMFIGQMFFNLAISFSRYWFAVLGRALLGLCGPSLFVAIDVIVTHTFKNNYLSVAMAFIPIFIFIAGVSTDYLTPYIYNSSHSVSQVFWIGFIINLSIGIPSLITVTLIQRRVQILQKHKIKRKTFSFSQILHFGKQFWILATAFFFVHSSIGPFLVTSGFMFPQRFKVSDTQLGDIFATKDYISISLSVIFGLLINKFGKRALFFGGLTTVLILSQIYFLLVPSIYSFAIPCIGMIIFAIGYAAFWIIIYPCIPLLVPEEALGVAFGIIYCLDSAGSSLTVYLIGLIHKTTKHDISGYYWALMFLIIILLVGLTFAIILIIYDFSHTKILNLAKVKNIQDTQDGTIKE